MMTKHHNPPFPLDQTSSQPSQELGQYPIGIKPEVVELPQQFNDIEAARRDVVLGIKAEEPPLVIGNIDMCKLRDLLFSIRDNQIYCPICRCPEFSPNEFRSSHFEPCSVGEICEKFLALYPRPELTVKWRK